ncbi:DUF1499 domain-containing protein [Brevundimonas sp.]|uniref:DUF1499 domain-containing protein n=1 Tax=Brevundimonas sp. TaxID=1871086 RepID=UPI002E10E202|nr:DUF1499 domain-containing protein [Brevundimonas sp.]
MFTASMGTRGGFWSPDFALDVLTFRVAAALTALGAVCALVLAVQSMRRPRAVGLAAAIAVLAVGATASGLGLRWSTFNGLQAWDVSSDRDEPPGFSDVLARRRAAEGAARAPSPAGPQACPGAVSVASQLTPEAASAALEDAGFTVIGSAPFRVEGERRGFWFDLAHDAVVRIRPGRTDLRVTARAARAQGEETCRLASALSRALAARVESQPGA